jgi:hypothetical protein
LTRTLLLGTPAATRAAKRLIIRIFAFIFAVELLWNANAQ